MRFISRNTRPPERRPHGLTLDDVRGLIRKPVSYWAIDESGNPSRKSAENGKAFTLSAVTELSPIDYDRLLEGVPMYDGEVHFSKLRNEHPDICIRLMTNLGYENLLILSKTVTKKSKSVISKKRGPLVDELYLLSLLEDTVDAISAVDLSDAVVIVYDRNTNLKDDTCLLLWTDRCFFLMGESDMCRLLQISDLTASSLGRAVLPLDEADTEYFDKIRMRSVNLQENGDRPQHNPAFLPHNDRDSKYLTDSEPAKKGSRISKNAKIGRRTETRDIPQYRPARLQPDDRDSEYLTRSEQKRPGLAGCTQHPAFAPMGAGGLTQRPPSASIKRLDGSTQLPSSAPWVSDSGSDYKEYHRCDQFGSKCAKKRCIQCN